MANGWDLKVEMGRRQVIPGKAGMLRKCKRVKQGRAGKCGNAAVKQRDQSFGWKRAFGVNIVLGRGWKPDFGEFKLKA